MKKSNLNNLSKYLSINLVFKVLVRILFISFLFHFFNNEKPNHNSDLQSYYKSISSGFYFSFLFSLDRYLYYSNKKLSNPELLLSHSLFRLLNYLKWFLLFITVVLLVLTISIMPMDWPDALQYKILYVLVKILPNIFGTNISFIIITMLAFYAASIAGVNQKLQQEQDLTI